MKGGALLCVLLTARALTLAFHEAALVDGAGAVLFGLLSDVAVATLFGALDLALRRPRWTWLLYVGVAALAAIDVEVARALGTPVTPVMLAGARGALADSFAQYMTTAAALRVLTLTAVVVVAPRVLATVWSAWSSRALPRRGQRWAAMAAMAAAVASLAVGTTPLHRNAVTALVRLPAAAAGEGTPPRPATATGVHDLRHLRGTAAARNVLVVVLESTGAAPLGLHGASGVDPMPRLTALGRGGIVFEAAYTAFPESIRELAAYWESWHPRVGVPAERMSVPATAPLPALLGAAGYRTALFHSGHFDYLGMEHVVRGRGFDTRVDASGLPAATTTSFGADEETTVDALLDWVNERPGDAPFLAAYLPIAGHHPYDTPHGGPFDASTETGQYRNALRYADDALGRLLDGLAARGVLDETLVVVTGDHGEAFGEHPGNYGHTFHLYEENVHVPLLFAMPGADLAPARVSRVASHVDIAPTVTDLLGLTAGVGWEGHSLLDPLERPAHFATDWAERLSGTRDGRWKTIRSLETGDVERFDLATDAAELRRLP